MLRLGINNPSSIFYDDTTSFYPTAKFIIDKIHEFGGLAFLAHPFQYGENKDYILDKLRYLLDGVECYHFTTEEKDKCDELLAFCSRNNLLTSGGSDFHKTYDEKHKKDRLNGFNIPANMTFDVIISALNQRNNLIYGKNYFKTN